MSIYDVDPKTFARIERPKPTTKVAPAVVNVRNNLLSLTTVPTGYGLSSEVLQDALEGFLMCLFPTSSTNAYKSDKFARSVVVLDGSGSLELNSKKIKLEVGALVIIPSSTEFRFFTETDYLVLAVSQPAGYADSLVVTRELELKGALPEVNNVHAPGPPKERYKSKLQEQLAAQEPRKETKAVESSFTQLPIDEPFNPLDPNIY